MPFVVLLNHIFHPHPAPSLPVGKFIQPALHGEQVGDIVSISPFVQLATAAWTPEVPSSMLVGLATGTIVRCAYHRRISVCRVVLIVRVQIRIQYVVGILGGYWEAGCGRRWPTKGPRAGACGARAADGSALRVFAARWPVLVFRP